MTHAVVEWLLSDATVSGLVGANAGGDTDKIYQAVIPQGEKPPFVCIRVAAFSTNPCKGEPSNEEFEQIQVDCYAGSYRDTYILYRAIRQLMDGQSFTAPSDGTEISAQIASGRDYTEDEMAELTKRNIWGITSIYNCEVTLGSIT